MAIMTQDTTTPEADAEVMALLDAAREAAAPASMIRIHGVWVNRPAVSEADRDLARAMADYRAQAVIDNDEAVEILPGEDTICVICECPLPAGATGYRDKREEGRLVRCCDCKAFEDKAAGRTNR